MKKLVKFIFKLLLILIIGFVGVFFGKGYWNYLQLTETKSVDEVVNEVRTSPYYVDYDDISPNLIRATIAIEDRRFYDHGGFDYIGLVRAAVSQFDEDLLTSGGSTITQQLAKNLYGMFESSWDRKSTEFFVARYLEKHYSKNEIITLCGDGFSENKDFFINRLNKNPKNYKINKLDYSFNIIRASNSILLSESRYKAGDFDDIFSLSPLYLRKSEAENRIINFNK